jgi:hypothetical protein
MLKLTLADWSCQSEGPIWINPSLVTHVCSHHVGSYLHFQDHGHFVKESAEQVARMMDEEEEA